MKTVRQRFAEKTERFIRFDRGYWCLMGIGAIYFGMILTFEFFGVK